MRNIRKRKSEAGLGRRDSTKLRDLAQHKSGFAQTVEDDLAITVLFNARWRDAGWIMLACLISFNGARAGAYLLGPELGVCIGTILMGAGSNLYSRWL